MQPAPRTRRHLPAVSADAPVRGREVLPRCGSHRFNFRILPTQRRFAAGAGLLNSKNPGALRQPQPPQQVVAVKPPQGQQLPAHLHDVAGRVEPLDAVGVHHVGAVNLERSGAGAGGGPARAGPGAPARPAPRPAAGGSPRPRLPATAGRRSAPSPASPSTFTNTASGSVGGLSGRAKASGPASLPGSGPAGSPPKLSTASSMARCSASGSTGLVR